MDGIDAIDGWDGFSWVNEPVHWEIDAGRRLHWDTRPASDFWRHTGGVVGADDGDAFLRQCSGDFSVTMLLHAEFESQYDQCGLMVRGDGWNWLKAGIELDGGSWFSVVETHQVSDWSKQAITGGNAEFTIWRTADTLRVGLVQQGSMHLVRELVFDTAVAVGPYSCSPKGPGFRVSVSTATGSQGEWLIAARVQHPG